MIIIINLEFKSEAKGRLERGLPEYKVTRSVRVVGGEVLFPKIEELFPRYLVTHPQFFESFASFSLLYAMTVTNVAKLVLIDRSVTRGIFEVEHELHVRLLPVRRVRWIFRVIFPHGVPLVSADLSILISVSSLLQALPDLQQRVLRLLRLRIIGAPMSRTADPLDSQIEVLSIDGTALVDIEEGVEDVEQLLLAELGQRHLAILGRCCCRCFLTSKQYEDS